MIKNGDILMINMTAYQEWLSRRGNHWWKHSDESLVFIANEDAESDQEFIHLDCPEMSTQHRVPTRFIKLIVSKSPIQNYFLGFD